MTTTPLEKVLDALRDRGGDPRQNGSGWTARCPSHDDQNPSLSVTAADDGTVLVRCHAGDGCQLEQITTDLKLSMKDLFPASSTNGKAKLDIVATYPYVDEGGRLLYEVCRLVPKSFRQRRPKPEGGWLWKVGDVRKVPFRLPELLEAVAAGRWVVVVEGEKDVLTLAQHGIVATCNAGGAGKWPKEFAAYLKGARVAVIPDNDPPGEKHAHAVASSLKGIADKVVALAPLSREPGGDVTDWLHAQDDQAAAVAELKDLIRGANVWEPEGAPPDNGSSADCGHAPPGALAEVLDEVVGFLEQYMSMTAEQFDAVALWVAHTHAVDHFDVCAYLHVSSADKRCGKSLLLDLLEHLVLRGRSTANISPAALYRMIEAQHPTLLFDEIDNIFSKGKNADPSMTALTGLINAGFRKGRVAYRMGGPNMRELEEFDPFGPKALAGIGSCLPDTTADRAIPIKLARKGRDVAKARYRIRLHEKDAQDLGHRVGSSVAVVGGLGERWPDLPAELNDRQQDIWEPMFALADAAGGEWPERARKAAKVLHATSEQAESVMARLLGDIRSIYEPRDDDGKPLARVEKMLTKHLAAKLNDLEESGWGDWRAGQGISSAQIVQRLRDYGIRSKPMRVGDEKGKGFHYDELVGIFSSYLTEDTEDTEDNGPKDQVNPVPTSENATEDTPGTDPVSPPGNPTGDTTEDESDQGKQPVVPTVPTVLGGVPEGDPYFERIGDEP